MKKLLTLAITIVFFSATTPFALATDYNIELVVPDDKKSKETDAVLRINKEDFQTIIEKGKFKENEKTFSFKAIKVADYSYSKNRCFRVEELLQLLCWSDSSLPYRFFLSKRKIIG